jgi:hypothetical protein
MPRSRHPDLQASQSGIRDAAVARLTEQALKSRLNAGGYLLAFITERSLESRYVGAEIEFAISHFPEQVLMVILDDID